MTSPSALYGLATVASHLRLLAERDPHPDLFDAADPLLDRLDAAGAPAALARFELVLLAELGFGLDLNSCAATGSRDDLAYVSPRSGRAVGRGPGEPYRSRLLPLPGFLRTGAEPAASDLADAFRLTGHFLDVHLYGARGLTLPDERDRFVGLATGGRPSRAGLVGSVPAPHRPTDSGQDGTG